VAHHLFLAFAAALEGKREEYEAWYDSQHLPDVLRVPGFISAQRYHVVGRRPEKTTRGYQYLTIYEIDSDDIDGTIGELRSRIAAGAISTGTLFDPALLGFYTVTAASPRLFATRD
jgi:hypothetical protein